ncbi:response regulator transcription factor [Kallipyga gabonensis]|uniref:response regulator transcription factor n=1 Tax=Kallipyga gabonensis TaxID=1686287 RepID=UPI0006B42367|nr:response regulator [Kallipyga gabonensis]
MLKVLLVEDENLIRRGLLYKTDWTELQCVVVGEAGSGTEGLAQIEALRPDIVITDIRMPDMDGLEMLRKGQDICPFYSIILSGYSEFDYAQQAIHLGVTEYLLKPLDENELKDCLKRIVAAHENQAASPSIKTSEEPVSLKNKYADAMLQYIRNHYAERISLTDLSQELNISCTHLNAKFKAETGYTFHAFLNYYRIRRAVELQKSGQYKLYEIAELVGFSDYKYFNKVFKKYTGYSPNVIFPR